MVSARLSPLPQLINTNIPVTTRARPVLITKRRFSPSLSQTPIIMSSNPKISCQCGAISLTAPLPSPLFSYACHCLQCRAQSASAFGISYIFPAADFWPPSDPATRQGLSLWTRPTDAGNTLECWFCKVCGVRVVHRGILPDGTPKPTVSVKGGCVEGVSLEGVKHIWTRTALVDVPEGSALGEP